VRDFDASTLSNEEMNQSGPKTNYLLIDYENVQVKCLSALNGHPFKVLIFLGVNQTRIPVELATSIQALGSNAQYVPMSGSGTNALDFHIAFTVGQLAAREPDAHFHIISKDSGFDPLIEFARKQKLHVHRSKDVAEIPLLRLANAHSASEKVQAIVQNLELRRTGRPRVVKTLTNTINTLFRHSLEPAQLASLIRALEQDGHISIDNENVTFHLPTVS